MWVMNTYFIRALSRWTQVEKVLYLQKLNGAPRQFKYFFSIWFELQRCIKWSKGFSRIWDMFNFSPLTQRHWILHPPTMQGVASYILHSLTCIRPCLLNLTPPDCKSGFLSQIVAFLSSWNDSLKVGMDFTKSFLTMWNRPRLANWSLYKTVKFWLKR